ncbi:MAG: FAD-dependent monooxygenase [Chloroflexota bacterium]
MSSIDLLIIGTGPAGTSTALHLLQQDPSWRSRMVLVDKAVHPREKLCGGGITHFGENILSDLGLPFEPTNFEIQEVRLTYGEKWYSFRGDPVFRIVHRAEFDHWLVKEVEAAGGIVSQGEAVTDVQEHANYIEVKTDRRTFHAKAIVAADGSYSVVRKKLKWSDPKHLSHLIEVLTPETHETSAEFRENRAVFDFSPMTSHKLQGYYWDFPSIVDGELRMNRGVFDSRSRPERERANLKQTLNDAMEERDRQLDSKKVKGHPIRWMNLRGQYSRERILLAGDAAGADPLFGEGIGVALAYGKVAAHALTDAFERNDFSFRSYKRRVLTNGVLFSVAVRTAVAGSAYRLKSRRGFEIGWGIARFIISLTPWSKPSFKPARPPKQSKRVVSL